MKPQQPDWSRKKFIASVTAAGAGMALSPLQAWTIRQADPRVNAIVAKTIGTDTHNHIDVPLTAQALPGTDPDLRGELQRSGLAAICMTFAVDYQQPLNPGDGYTKFTGGLDAMDRLLRKNNITRSLNLPDLQSAHTKKNPAVIQAVEGGHFLEGKLERLSAAYTRGLRVFGLLHDNDASVPLGDVYTKPPQWNGLTDFGKQVVKEANKLGMLIDLTHASNKTIDDALALSTQPIIISHTGLNTQLGNNAQMAKMMYPRLISKEQAAIVAKAGGVIGVWTHLSDTVLAYAANIRAMADVVGVDHVCIGTDTKLTPAYRPPARPNQTDTARNNQPQRQNERVGERTNNAWQDQQGGFFYAVVDALLKTGFTEEEIIKIGGGNFCRVFGAATAHR